MNHEKCTIFLSGKVTQVTHKFSENDGKMYAWNEGMDDVKKQREAEIAEGEQPKVFNRDTTM